MNKEYQGRGGAREVMRRADGASSTARGFEYPRGGVEGELGELLGAFYAKHKPEQADKVPELARDFQGREAELNNMLYKKYGEDLLAASRPPRAAPAQSRGGYGDSEAGSSRPAAATGELRREKEEATRLAVAAAGGKTESRAVRRARREAAWREKGPTKEQREAYQAGTPLPAGENYVATSSTAADASAVLRVESDTSTQSAAPSDSSASSAGESAVPRVESDASTQSTAASSEGDVAVPRVEPPLSEATVVRETRSARMNREKKERGEKFYEKPDYNA
ncbi:hypothetical protein T484DRAFT_1774258 [Baffinella frigidus]|nr:hypothetical protein T484DRAFT_1774258 [Cryptophyta sp. CCMP2293]